MKIGILTLHYSNNNYGAVLQAYAIYRLVEELGHEAYIIDYQPPINTYKEKILYLTRQVLGFRFEKFRTKYINRIKTLPEKLEALNKDLDAFIVGSDQVWRYRNDHKVLLTYFLDFAKDRKIKIAYAASFGLDYWEGNSEITDKISKSLKGFKSISLREESGVRLCKQTFNIDGEQVLDPTLMLDKKHFNELVKSPKINISNKYFAYMILDDNKDVETYFKELASKNNIQFKNIKGQSVLPSKGLYLFNSINKWLYLLKNAEFVVTDSFHCTVFSVIFQKNFICLTNQTRGTTRLENFLKIIDESHRFVKDLKGIETAVIWKDINYPNIELILKKERNKSLQFLKKNL